MVHKEELIHLLRKVLLIGRYRKGLSFHGHDESETSNNRGNFLALYQYTADHNEDIKSVILGNAPDNEKLIAPEVQKKIVNAFASETTNIILKDLGGSLFSILIDESRDVSVKEQMAIVIRYVDKRGCIIEWFLGVVHVNETSALSLKEAIDALFSKHSLSMASLRGQGYDGLQLALVGVAKNEPQIALLFNMVSKIGNIASSSCKRRDKLRDKQAEKIAEAFECGELVTGKVAEVVEDVVEDGLNAEQRGEAIILVDTMRSFEFIFDLHLMKNILEITNALSKALQRKDQDIINAMSLVSVTKSQLQAMRDNGWEDLLRVVFDFCSKHNVTVPKMEDTYVSKRRSERKARRITNFHHYHAQLFINVLDWQKEELKHRFSEVNTELLICMSYFHPNDSFSSFDKSKLVHLAELYPRDFSTFDRMLLGDELETYIVDVCSRADLLSLDGISSL